MKFLTKKKKFLNNLIIFTSESTGTPKGVKITADCLNHFLEWSVGLGGPAEEKQGAVFLNQAPFSFDLYTCLACGGILCADYGIVSVSDVCQSVHRAGVCVQSVLKREFLLPLEMLFSGTDFKMVPGDSQINF